MSFLNIFLSYSRLDNEFALKFAKDLKALNVNLWIDQLDIVKGSRWDDSIQDALRISDSLIILLSEDSVKSHNVLDELSYAIEENKKIIPIKISDCDIPFRLRRFQYIDFVNNFNGAWEEVLTIMGVSQKEGVVGKTHLVYETNLNEITEKTIAKEYKYSILKEEKKYDFIWGKHTRYEIQFLDGKTEYVYKGESTGKYFYTDYMSGKIYCKDFEKTIYNLWLYLNINNH